nr:hypothetical protein [Tanacetum cinerariifolium]
EEGEQVDLACSGGITSAIGAITSGARGSTLGGGVKEYQEKDKIGSKPDKNEKRGKAKKSLKQFQWIKEEKLKKKQKEWSKTHTRSNSYSNFKRKKKRKGPEMQ